MSKHITSVELSAFVDGEAKEPIAVETHIAQCQSCRDTVAGMKNMSHSLGSLPAPDVHPAFAGRIVATLEERPAPRRVRSMPWVFTFAGVAAMGLLVASAYLPIALRGENAPMQVTLVNDSQTAPSLELRDEATLLAEFDRVFADNDSAFTNAMLQSYAAEPIPEILDDEFIVMALADNQVIDSVTNEWAVANDIRSIVNNMNESETSLFKQLLTDSAQSELTGDALQKG